MSYDFIKMVMLIINIGMDILNGREIWDPSIVCCEGVGHFLEIHLSHQDAFEAYGGRRCCKRAVGESSVACQGRSGKFALGKYGGNHKCH